MSKIDFFKMRILGNCIEQMSADAEDKGEETFGIRLSLEDAEMITHSMIFYSRHHWIPVSERLPDADEMSKCLYVNKYGYYITDAYISEVGGTYECENDYTILCDVVAWMPLPEPYKESEEE